MRQEIIRCDKCKKEHDAQYCLPSEWITTKQRDRFDCDEEKHFCSKSCLIAWASEEVRNTADWEKLTSEQQLATDNFRRRISEILGGGMESFYKEHPDLVFQWHVELNVFLRADKQEMQEP